MNLIKSLTIIFFALSVSSCAAKKESLLGDSKLLLSIEKRDYNSDRVTQTNFFDNALMQEIILHDTSSQANLFKSKLVKLDGKKLEELKIFANKLNKLDYENSFPWKEGLYDRGNVYKISFVSTRALEYIARKDKKDSSSVSFEKILYYYQGHKQSPLLFKELMNFTETL